MEDEGEDMTGDDLKLIEVMQQHQDSVNQEYQGLEQNNF